MDPKCSSSETAPAGAGRGEVLVKLAAAGVNYTDISQRSGSNKIPLPAVLGSEGAGTVERVGAGCERLQTGRPRRLLDGARFLCGVCRGTGEDAGEDPRRNRFPNRRGRHAAGHDRALSVSLDVSLKGRSYRARPRSRRRNRPSARANGGDAGRARDRDGGDGSQSGPGARGRRERRDPV